MPGSVYIFQRGEVRIYDGTPTTPNYLKLPFVQADGRFPISRARPEATLRLDRGLLNTYTHYTPGTDDIVVSAVPVTMTLWLFDQLADDVIAALGNPYDLATWSVGTSVFVTAAGTGGSIVSGNGTSFAVPQFGQDPLHRRVHFEWLFGGRVAGTNDRLFRHEECYVPRELLIIGDGDPVTLSVTYHCFGKMSSGSAFTAGTNITPAVV